jgi:uncharacterized membrane protein HdeD (DUF308 family)
MTEAKNPSQLPQQRQRWIWFLVLGAILLVLGLAGISMATVLEWTSLLVFGPLLLASSLIQFMVAIFAEKGKDNLLHFVAAGLEAILGLLFIVHPLEKVASLIALVAIFLMVIGLARLARPLMAQSRNRGWRAFAGIVALLLGISLLIGWPAAKLWIVGLFIGIDFICHGISWAVPALMQGKTLEQSVS